MQTGGQPSAASYPDVSRGARTPAPGDMVLACDTSRNSDSARHYVKTPSWISRCPSRRRRFPTILLANIMGFDDKPYFEAIEGAEEPPKVEF